MRGNLQLSKIVASCRCCCSWWNLHRGRRRRTRIETAKLHFFASQPSPPSSSTVNGLYYNILQTDNIESDGTLCLKTSLEVRNVGQTLDFRLETSRLSWRKIAHSSIVRDCFFIIELTKLCRISFLRQYALLDAYSHLCCSGTSGLMLPG